VQFFYREPESVMVQPGFPVCRIYLKKIDTVAPWDRKFALFGLTIFVEKCVFLSRKLVIHPDMNVLDHQGCNSPEVNRAFPSFELLIR